ncbi:G protein-coupled glucose receptor regulating Gpa2-domain-containing protein [Amylocarpus encephaloides]|uniref:G protein-coupled glucose receptor regulating Gpa2-domain-containing protein n=1 Tax=Amylocarpus encephaloides TaxID=45428 RepID=A0A9P7YSW8_9HELO|nr:G protein-coupled glucose receptor regulating Gpa2-domain-containing protein [Amylocarpus encephaloides]
MSSFDPAVAIPTLVGSLLSCVSSGLIFACYIFLPQIPHFRHVLILNLSLADFINSFNNSISGIYMFANDGGLSDGGKCTVNGFIGQMSVQGTDFAILLIAMATVFALRGNQPILDTSLKSKIILSFCVWLVPFTTSIVALGLGAYTPVSGNWCWISKNPPVLRYALNHGWRFLIILITVCLYIYLYFYFRAHFSEIKDLMRPASHSTSEPNNLKLNPIPDDEDSFEEFEMRNKGVFIRPYDAAEDTVPISSSKVLTNITSYTQSISSPSTITPFNYPHTASVQRKQHEIQKVLLLNAYPVAYVILWLPGIINRIYELNGDSSLVFRILQSSSQYVGLANAITYGYNEGIKRQLRTWWDKKRGNGHQFSESVYF